jgi:prepilin-type processing-associated H-X9-DG protein
MPSSPDFTWGTEAGKWQMLNAQCSMKMVCEGKNRGLTLIEALAVIVILMLLAGVLLPPLALAKYKARRVGCANNLKHVGSSFQVFANNHADKFPMQLPTHQGGSLEFVASGNAFRHFLAISNDLTTPQILICPADTRKPAASFSVLSNMNISYFVGLDALDTFPQSLLAGDRHLMTNGVPAASGILLLTTNLTVGWTTALHNGSGNVVLGDGSVQPLTSARLQKQIADSGIATNRLAIP